VEYELSREASASLGQDEVEAVAVEEELDALPIAEEEGGGDFNFGNEDELDALPISDEDTEFAQPKSAGEEAVDADDDEAIPVADDILEGRELQLPQSNDLRDILSQMDEPKGKRRPKAEE
jgi:hypothetical protein